MPEVGLDGDWPPNFSSHLYVDGVQARDLNSSSIGNFHRARNKVQSARTEVYNRCTFNPNVSDQYSIVVTTIFVIGIR